MIPDSGVMLGPDSCSLMVTVPSEGLVHSMVVAWPAVTSRVLWPSGMLMAFCCASATEAKRATAAVMKRMLTVYFWGRLKLERE